MALITLKNVTISFEGIVAVQNISLSVKKGDYLVVVGENGSGKSTLIRAILGLVKPQQGTVRYGDGLTQNQVGYLPQQTLEQRDFPASVEEVVLSGCVSSLKRKLFFGKREKRLAEEKMQLLAVDGMRKKSFRNLSGGQQQRVLLARALCATNSILLLDEPVTGLDPEATDELYQIIKSLNRDHGVTVIMVSHDIHGALRDADKVLMMNRGMSFLGSKEEYLERFGKQVAN